MNDPIEVLITLPFPEKLLAQLKAVSPRLQLTVRKAKKPDEIGEIWATEVLHRLVLPAQSRSPTCTDPVPLCRIDHALDAPILNKPGLLVTTLMARPPPRWRNTSMTWPHQRMPDSMAHQRVLWAKNRRTSRRWLRGTVGTWATAARPSGARLLQSFMMVWLQNDVMHEDGITPGCGDPTGDFAFRLYPSQAHR
jgi:hypothetical protein